MERSLKSVLPDLIESDRSSLGHLPNKLAQIIPLNRMSIRCPCNRKVAWHKKAGEWEGDDSYSIPVQLQLPANNPLHASLCHTRAENVKIYCHANDSVQTICENRIPCGRSLFSVHIHILNTHTHTCVIPHRHLLCCVVRTARTKSHSTVIRLPYCHSYAITFSLLLLGFLRWRWGDYSGRP